MKRTVGSVGRDEREERLLVTGRVPDELNTVVKEDITAESPRRNDLPVVPVAPIEIIIIP